MAQKGKKHTLTLATMPLIHPHAAGSDVGAEEHWVCVPADRDAQPVQTLSAFPWDVHRLADWFTTCRITTVVMASTGVDWIRCFTSSQPAVLQSLSSMPAMSQMALGVRKRIALIVGGSKRCSARGCWRRHCVRLRPSASSAVSCAIATI
jgi:hypothetical protein